MKLPFRIVNVFTTGDDRLSGNPLCVFEDARGLSTPQMQALARQLNLSETTFVLPPERGGSARVRIFTPGFEMPFAGHPTLGTSSVVARGGSRVVLELNAGDIEVSSDGGRWTLRALAAPKTRAVDASRAELAAMVGVPESAIAGEPLWVSTGVEQLVIPIASADHVRAARPVPELVHRHGYAQSRDEAMAYLWAPATRSEATDPDTARSEATVRFFFTQHGAVIEDPATGSAAANLGGYFVATKRALPVEMTLRQGDAVARPSTLHLRVDAHGAIFVGGDVIELASGTFDL
jgi:PhzF family phenazine biosynthesis protein